MVTAIQTITAAPMIMNSSRAADRNRMVRINCWWAMVVSATVTLKGTESMPVEAERASTATRMGSPRNVASSKAAACPSARGMDGRFWYPVMKVPGGPSTR